MAGSYWSWGVKVNSKGSTTASNTSSAILRCPYHGGEASKNLRICISRTLGMRRAISLWGARSFIYYLLLELLVLKAVAVVVAFVLVVFLWFILQSLPRGVMIRPPQQKLRQKLRDEYHAPQFSALTSYAKLTFGCTSAHKKRD